MLRKASFLTLAALAAACAAPDGAHQGSMPGMNFAPPAAAPATPAASRHIAVSPAQARARLTQVASADPAISLRTTAQPNILDVRYSGDAAPLLDCGTARSGTDQWPGAARRVTIADPGGAGGNIERELTLDARTTVALAPNEVRLRSDYVAVETVERRNGAGAVTGRTRDLASSDEAGRLTFRSGASCVVTGALERGLLRAVAGEAAGLASR